ncbi:putative hydroxymethylpyrimidine transport system substrate-binding protein [Faunimonas pinastri]|uniref:Putative hydroxymethylpyrimidine transport system substrate-binding protein n=1 Tax=Faunimonas pinastri TaxID=1855383 RepID=A0A1H9L8T2_9HYPH|nr:ABC transporter substrate-binding protein [Faunimonas pinastri]SER07413.1 putative hydroxymethylpyrimidine transport system substrate-binding protein [Faunimonas pinastri]
MLRLCLALALFFSAVAPAAAADKLTLLLDWFVNPEHAPLVVAQEKGYFAEQNLDVTLVPPSDPSAPPRLLAAGQGDIAITYQPNLYLQVAEGLPVVRFGTLVDTPLNTVMALENGPIRTLADLKGKTVGYSIGGFEDILLKRMLETVGLSLSDVRLVDVNFALTPALLAGRVDAVVGAYRNFEATELALQGKPARAFYPEEHGVPPFDEVIFIARKDELQDDRLRRFLAAVEKADLFIANHPDEAFALFTKSHPDLANELNRRAYADTWPRLSKSPAGLDVARYERFGQFMKDEGLIKQAPPVADYAVALH